MSAEVTTSLGRFAIDLNYRDAANEVAQFVHLVKSGYYKDKQVDKVSRGYSIQLGRNPARPDGTSGHYIREPKTRKLRHDRPGIVSFVRRHRGTASSEFIITLQKAAVYDDRYLVFGVVTRGLDVVEKIANAAEKSGLPLKPVTIKGIKLVGDTKGVAPPRTVPVPDAALIRSFTDDLARRLSQSIALTESLGKVKEVNYVDAVSRGLTLQAFYRVQFEDESKSNLEIMGSLDNDDGAFELKQLQFRR